MLRTKRRANPLFYPDEFRLELGAERAQRALDDPDSLDLLLWNVFGTLDTHGDRDWLAYRLQALGGPAVRAPVRLSLFSGAEREPLLRPSPGYVETVRARARAHGGDDASIAAFVAPVEVPVRIESPEALVLVDAALSAMPRGRGGRDRLVELVDAGSEHARRLDKSLSVAVVSHSSGDVAAELSARVEALRDPVTLAAQLPHRRSVPPVTFRLVTWQQLLRMWQDEAGYLDVGGQPVTEFLEHCRRRDLLQR